MKITIERRPQQDGMVEVQQDGKPSLTFYDLDVRFKVMKPAPCPLCRGHRTISTVKNNLPCPACTTGQPRPAPGSICPACRAGDHEHADVYHGVMLCDCACNSRRKAAA
jgi:hypothetical protein